MIIRPLSANERQHYAGDGQPCGLTHCPICGQPAIVIDHYLGGWGYHKAYRCQSNPEHIGPLFWDEEAHVYLPGLYFRIQWPLTHEIIPTVDLSLAPKSHPETILEAQDA